MTNDLARPSPIPQELASWEAAGRDALTACTRADEWGASTRRAVLAGLDRIERLVAAVRARVITAEREDGTWALRGDRDLAGFVGRESHQGRAVGLAHVGQAATLAAMPTVAEALVDGPVTVKHVTELTRAAAASPALASELATPAGQAHVVELARRWDGVGFGRQLRQLSAALDPAARQRQHDEQRANRYLHISHAPGGTLVKARLDSVAGHKLAKAIDALDPRPAVDDEHDRAQRRADALVLMVDRTLRDKETTPGALAPVQAVVTFSEETWAALRAARDRQWPEDEQARRPGDRRPAPGSAGAVVASLRGVAPVVDETGQAWPASEVARALCDCALTRVVLDAAGQPLDLGHRDRLFTRAHWLALYGSGQRTCAVEGCGMPLRYTELHHMAWWQRDGGRTDLANCAPECGYHHHEVHRLDLRVRRRSDGSYEHRHPDGRRYGGAPPAGRSSCDDERRMSLLA